MLEMKPIRKLMDKFQPPKESRILHTVWDGIDTFLFAPKITTLKGTHIKDGMDLKRTMIHVVIALQLCYIAGTINIGHQHYVSLGMYPGLFDGMLWKLAYGLTQLLPIFIVVHVVGLGIEFFFAAKKGHGIEEGFLVSGALIPLIMPPDVPLWIVAVATVFAVLIAKEAFGGTGMNILNVALTARVFVFFAYPTEISGEYCWVAYDYSWIQDIIGLKAHTVDYFASLGHDFSSFFDPETGKYLIKDSPSPLIDGWSGATPLGLAAEGGWQAVQNAQYSIYAVNDGVISSTPTVYNQYSVASLIWGNIPGSIGEMNKLAIMFGVAVLAMSKIGSWRIMLSMVLGCAFMGILFNIMGQTFGASLGVDANSFLNVPWYYQFLMGSFFFAMAYMATDPVTATSTATGKIIYGFMIGALGLLIRVLNPAYPEGWMLAILFLNVFAPLVDHFVVNANIKRRMSYAN